VADRIEVVWASEDADVVAALDEHAAGVADEVLAERFERVEPGALPEGDHREEADLDGDDAGGLTVVLRRVRP
jgi:hypothetical protein